MKKIDMSIAQLVQRKRMKVLNMPLRPLETLIRNINLLIMRHMAQEGKVAY